MPLLYRSANPHMLASSSAFLPVNSNGTTAKSAGRMGCHPYDPLTTTSSLGELTMADANHKSRPKKRNLNTRLAMILRSTPDRPKRGWPYLPWMSVIDAHFKLFGFEPGDRVYLDINHKTRQITITPDCIQGEQRA
ncbi:hypothetical protein [Burkholderia ubonensis]|uniref:hypothetical protein n=2 Tax=Burkholderia ubonensis TaxID=101571 RepID=UPI001E3F8C40|nr:hypothetical protein [Burkholderia ubonensis]